MRTRSSTFQSKRHRHMTQILVKYGADGKPLSPNPWQTTITSGFTPSTWYDGSHVISDVVGRKNRGRYDVHPCTHTKTKVLWDKPLSGATQAMELSNSGYSNVYTIQQHEPYSYISVYHPTQLQSSSFFTGTNGNYSSGAYLKPDWFALQDAFLEACDSFMPMNVLLGETLIDYEGITDLVKIAINPTRALGSFIKLVKSIGLEKHNLGRIKQTLKHASGGTLQYSFGVRPAIQDLIGIFDAHRKVSSRFSYLVSHGGQFVPVRVRRRFPSTISNSSFPIQPYTGTAFLMKQCDDKYVEATGSAWGRVRDDLNYSSIWRAYLNYFGLNKVVGLAWELIPFSFVVDWFTNTQERINTLTRLSVGSPYTEFRGMCYSKIERTIETVYLIPGANPVLSAYIRTPAAASPQFQIEKTSYERYLTIPTTSGVVDMSTLGLFHYILGGSLFIQRVLR